MHAKMNRKKRNRTSLMQKRIEALDWNQIRAFVETADTGSLSAAARKLGLTQPTLSRQVAAAEQQLGLTLFERVGKSMVITDAGLALLEPARTMATAADELRLAASGHSQAVDGLVTVSASETVAAYLVPPVLRRLRETAPGLVVELVTSDSISDLQRGEADIALRNVAPTQPELIGRRLRDGEAGFYASADWVRRHGHPRTADEALHCSFVGAVRDGRYLQMLRHQGLQLEERNFSCYARNTLSYWALAQRGLGIAAMMNEIADMTPEMVRVLEEVPPIRFPFWLVTHRALRSSRRIRVVFDALAEALG